MVSTERLELSKSRTFGEKLGDSFTFLRLNAGILLKTHLLLTIPLVLLVAGIFLLVFQDYFSLLDTIETGPFQDSVADRANSDVWFVQNLLFPSLVMSLVSLNSLLVFHLYERNPGQTLTFQNVLSAARKHYPKLLLAKLALFIAIFGPQLLVLAADYIVVRVLFSLLLGLISLVFYNLATCTELLILQHNYSPAKAINKSYAVMQRNFFDGLWVNGVTLLIFFLLSIAMQIPTWILENWQEIGLGEMNAGSSFELFAAILTAFSTLIGYLLFTLPASAAGILFFSIKERTNRAGIMERIQSLGVSEPQENIYLEDEQY